VSSEGSENEKRLLDEASHRKVEGAFDELRRAARNIDRAANEIGEAGGEERLSDLLYSASAEVRALVDRLMSEAYFRPPNSEEKQELAKWKDSLADRSTATDPTDGQESLFGEGGEKDIAA
jgi:hypothetical protein